MKFPVNVKVSSALFQRLFTEATALGKQIGEHLNEKLRIALPALLTEAASYTKPEQSQLALCVSEEVWNSLNEISNATGLTRAAIVKKVLLSEELCHDG